MPATPAEIQAWTRAFPSVSPECVEEDMIAWYAKRPERNLAEERARFAGLRSTMRAEREASCSPEALAVHAAERAAERDARLAERDARRDEYFRQTRAARWSQCYGLTEADYLKILTDQGGVCAICHLYQTDGGYLFVDHSHESGLVRGLLCSSCNFGLARWKDSVEFLGRAIEYLNHPPASASLGREQFIPSPPTP